MRRFVHAFRGIGMAVRSEVNLWFHIAAGGFVFAAAFFLQLPRVEWCLLALCVGFVIAAELLNTAIEKVVDLVSPDFHELARRAKDIAAGAVLVAAISSVVVGLLIFGPPLTERFGL